jgi:hypothetical protein
MPRASLLQSKPNLAFKEFVIAGSMGSGFFFNVGQSLYVHFQVITGGIAVLLFQPLSLTESDLQKDGFVFINRR